MRGKKSKMPVKGITGICCGYFRYLCHCCFFKEGVFHTHFLELRKIRVNNLFILGFCSFICYIWKVFPSLSIWEPTTDARRRKFFSKYQFAVQKGNECKWIGRTVCQKLVHWPAHSGLGRATVPLFSWAPNSLDLYMLKQMYRNPRYFLKITSSEEH